MICLVNLEKRWCRLSEMAAFVRQVCIKRTKRHTSFVQRSRIESMVQQGLNRAGSGTGGRGRWAVRFEEREVES